MADKTLDDLILESARIAIQLRNKFKEEKDDPTARFFTYALLLQDECVYVGSSNSIYMRLMEHMHDQERSSIWVREHGPVIRVLEVVRNSKHDDETYKTLEYMNLFGWQSVRGAGWCKLELRGPPAALHTFERDRADLNYMTRKEIHDALEIARSLSRDMNP